MTESAFKVTEEDLEAELANRDLYEFVKAAWRILHPTTPFVDGWHIEALCIHLSALVSGEIKKLLVNIAPRMTKSLVASVDLPAWVWINNPSATFLYASYSSDLASEHSALCRQLIESDWYRKYWGHVFRLDPSQNEKMNYRNDRHGSRAAFGMTSVAGHGANFNIVDDGHDREDWKHPNEIKRHIDAYDSGIYNAVTDPINSRRLVIGQRVTAGDLSNHLKEQGGWEVLVIPTEYDPKRSKVTSVGWKDPRTKRGELACPERWDRAAVDTVKKNRRLFEAFHQQDPNTDEGKIFPRTGWRYYMTPPQEIAKQAETIIQSWDLTTGGEKPGTSQNAGQVWAKIGGNKFLLDRVLDFMSEPQIESAITSMSTLWPKAMAKVIESKAAGPTVIARLKKLISGIIAWPPEGERMDSKVTRAYVTQPEHEAGNLWLPHPSICPWVEEYVEYMAAFPDGDFDDDVDSTTQAVTYLNRIPSSHGPESVGKGVGWLLKK